MAGNARGILIWLALAAAACGCRKRPAQPTVTINGTTWRVELATTAAQQYRGLSFRRSLPEDAGMLFVYSQPRVLQFCMRDCLIPLDIAMIGADLRVIKVYTMRVEPDRAGRRLYSSVRPAQFALEVAAGAMRRAGVRPGDKVTLSSDIPLALSGPGPGRTGQTPPQPADDGPAGPVKGAPRR